MIRGCVICESDVNIVAEFPRQPLANGLLKRFSDSFPVFPLNLAECRSCGHVQLCPKSRVPPEAMFETYPYRTGTSETMRRHFSELASSIAKQIEPEGLVVDVGCNDCTFIRALRELAPRARAIGVDPSDVSRNYEGVISAYFDSGIAESIAETHGYADYILMANCLAHTQRPVEMLCAARNILSLDGTLIVEVPGLEDLAGRRAYSSIYHEHVSYFSVDALENAASSAGLHIERVESVETHCGSMRVFLKRGAEPEARWGVCRKPDWEAFRFGIDHHRREMRNACMDATVIYGYTCPAKAVPLMHYTRIYPSAICDADPGKQGMFVPVADGSPIPIVHPDNLRERVAHMRSSVNPDRVRVIMFATNLRREILRLEGAAMRGSILIPCRHPEVV